MEDFRRLSASKYECLLFEYMLQNLKIEASQLPKMCLDLYREYGTTMAGLKALGYEFDNDEFHAYVHGRLPYDRLKTDSGLRNLLLSMPQRKIIFTNADKAHAARVLNRLLGLEDCFEGIICFETLNPPEKDTSAPSCHHRYQEEPDEYVFSTESESEDEIGNNPQSKVLCKPSLEAMEAAIQIAQIDPKKAIFFDDSARNIASGKALGLHTVIVGSSVLVPGADLALESIHNIREALPEIWAGEEEDQLEQVLHSTRVETTVSPQMLIKLGGSFSKLELIMMSKEYLLNLGILSHNCFDVSFYVNPIKCCWLMYLYKMWFHYISQFSLDRIEHWFT